jgi:predicted xylose isomerase-like sugar epimerase
MLTTVGVTFHAVFVVADSFFTMFAGNITGCVFVASVTGVDIKADVMAGSARVVST